MNIQESELRKLAKQIESLNTFSACKDLSGLQLFKNNRDLSKIQHLYLSYLFFYSNLHSDIALKKVSEKVLDNEIFEDAYSVYLKNKKEDNKVSKKEKDIHLVFKNNKKRNK